MSTYVASSHKELGKFPMTLGSTKHLFWIYMQSYLYNKPHKNLIGQIAKYIFLQILYGAKAGNTCNRFTLCENF
jgi:hypothetical protein